MSKIVVLMGVSGCGKSTIGEILAGWTNGAYFDGDNYHPEANVEKMGAGIPLTDEDRVGWFEALGRLISQRLPSDEWTFVACSALRRRYRDRLRQDAPDLRFVWLEGSFELIESRMQAREGHYMPASLLKSQFEALELPDDDERIPSVSIEFEPRVIAEKVAQALSLSVPEPKC
ncbi:MAG: gluconokinase [Verrucomicrobiota bacterium]